MTTVFALLIAVAAMVGNTIAALWEARGSRLARYGRPVWQQPWFLAGLFADVVAWVLTVVALRYLPVFAVQSILAGAIALTTLSDHGWNPWNLAWRDRGAVVAVLAGLVLVAAAAEPDRPEALPPAATPALLVAFVLILVATPFVWRTGRPMLLALLAGLGFGGTALAVRALHPGPLRWDTIGDLLLDPLVYGVVVMGVLGVLAFAKALQNGPVGPATAVLSVTEVVVPGVVGIALLGDRIRDGWAGAALIGVVVALAGVIALTRTDPEAERHRVH
jgi:drug/metabolite transporter (DMT)-like permease